MTISRCIPCATLFVDRHVSNSSVPWDNSGHSSEDSSIATVSEKLTQIQIFVNISWTDFFLGGT